MDDTPVVRPDFHPRSAALTGVLRGRGSSVPLRGMIFKRPTLDGTGDLRPGRSADGPRTLPTVSTVRGSDTGRPLHQAAGESHFVGLTHALHHRRMICAGQSAYRILRHDWASKDTSPRHMSLSSCYREWDRLTEHGIMSRSVCERFPLVPAGVNSASSATRTQNRLILIAQTEGRSVTDRFNKTTNKTCNV